MSVPYLLLHVPHASTAIPLDVRQDLDLDDATLRRKLAALTDHRADELYAVEDDLALTVRFPWSRLVVDVERFLDDRRELMTRYGQRAVYTRTAHGAALRADLAASSRQDLIDRFYRPHHKALTAAVARVLKAHDRALIVDCHTFPAQKRYKRNFTNERPDVCIGTDMHHTPLWLARLAGQPFRARGFKVHWNNPYYGAIVPTRYSGSDPRVLAVMIEVNQGCFAGNPGEGGDRFQTVREAVRDLLVVLTERLADGRPLSELVTLAPLRPGEPGQRVVAGTFGTCDLVFTEFYDPKDLYKCAVCGEYRGTLIKDTDEDGQESGPSTITCLCDAVPCRVCGRRTVRRPASDFIEAHDNSIGHVPDFVVMFPCPECMRPGRKKK